MEGRQRKEKEKRRRRRRCDTTIDGVQVLLVAHCSAARPREIFLVEKRKMGDCEEKRQNSRREYFRCLSHSSSSSSSSSSSATTTGTGRAGTSFQMLRRGGGGIFPRGCMCVIYHRSQSLPPTRSPPSHSINSFYIGRKKKPSFHSHHPRLPLSSAAFIDADTYLNTDGPG